MTLAETEQSTREDRFQTLTGNFEVAIEKGKHDPIERATDQLVAFACEQNSDCLTMFEVLEVAYKAMARGGREGRSAGELVLSGMENYLTTLGVCHKALVPAGDGSGEGIQRRIGKLTKTAISITGLGAAIGRAGKFRHKAPPEIPALRVLARVINHELTKSNEFDPLEPHIPIVSIFVQDSAVRELDRTIFQDSYQSYFDIQKAFRTFHSAEAMDFARLRFDVLQALLRQKTADGIPVIYTHKFEEDGVSFADIINASPDDVDLLGQTILRYLGSLPKGDIVWNHIAELFTLPGTYEPSDEQYGQAQQDVAWKLFLFQKWIGEKLFLPNLIQEMGADSLPEHVQSFQKVDRSFDHLCAKALSRLTPVSAHILGLAVYQSLAHSVSMIRKFHPTMSAEKANSFSPIVHVATLYHLSQSGSEMMIADRTIHHILQSQWGVLQEAVRTRLWPLWAARTNTTMFLNGFSTDVLKDYDKDLTRDVLGYIRANLGEYYLEKIGDIAAQLGGVNARLLEELNEPLDFWPHAGIAHTLRFPEKSLPNILGLESISMIFGQSPRDPIGFRFMFVESMIGLSGEVDPSTYTFLWHIDEETFDQQLLAVVNTIVLASLRDYVKKGTLITRERTHRVSRAEEGEEGESEHVVYERPAPRRSIRYVGKGEVEEVIVDADELVEAIEEEQERAGLMVRHIDAHRRTYVSDEQVIAYADALRNMRNAPAGKYGEAYAAAIDIRRQFRQPSADKQEAMSKLPPKLRLRPFLDPDTRDYLTDILPDRDEQPMYRDTFVVAYTRPVLTEKEMFSLPVRYERRYVAADGSAIAFLDELIPIMLGEESEQQEGEEA